MAIEFGPPGYYPERPQTDFWIPPTTVEVSCSLAREALASPDLNATSMFYLLSAATETHNAENYRRKYREEYRPLVNYARIELDPFRNASLLINPSTEVRFRLWRQKQNAYLPRVESVGANITTRGKNTISKRSLVFFRNPDGSVIDARTAYETDFSGTLIPGYIPLDKRRTRLEMQELAGYIEESLELLGDQR